jgi:prepilin-type N-terminal cleavage/methylation domain-containing protein
MPRRRQTDSGAFTLIELLAVVVILAVIGAMAIPLAVSTADMQVISASRMIATDLQYAQNVAITEQRPVEVAFVPASESHSLVYANESEPLIHPMTKGAYTVDFRTLDGFGAVDVVSVNFGGEAAVTFDELGAPDDAGSVSVQSGSHLYRVDVASATGKVTVTAVSP